LTLAALVVAGAGLVACSESKAPQGGPQAVEVGVVQLAEAALPVETVLPGRTVALQRADIRPQVGGLIKAVLFEEGAQVRAGQVLYELDAAPYEAALRRADAALQKAQANVQTAEVTARRQSELAKVDAVSRQDEENAQGALLQARADVAVAQAALSAARINLGYTRIMAPISGHVGVSAMTTGGLVTANQAAALTTITQLDPILVDVSQPSSEWQALQALMSAPSAPAKPEAGSDGPAQASVTVRFDDGREYPHRGRLTFTGVTVNPGTGALTLRARVPNPQGALMPGMYVQAVLSTGHHRKALLAPQPGVVLEANGSAYVWVVDAQNQLERRAVTLGDAVGAQWQVNSGLKAGERIVVDGLQRARPGLAVKTVVLEPKQSAPASAPDPASAPAAAS